MKNLNNELHKNTSLLHYYNKCMELQNIIVNTVKYLKNKLFQSEFLIFSNFQKHFLMLFLISFLANFSSIAIIFDY